MNDNAQTHTGGCSCGAIRYRIDCIFDVVYYHCTQCRKRTGAPVFLSVVVCKADFCLVQGKSTAYRSSAVGSAHFCGTCGSNFYFVETDGPYVSLTHGTLDEPGCVKPKAHKWTQDALAWLDICDTFLRSSNGTLPHPERR